MLKKTPITQYPKFPTSDWLGGEVTHFNLPVSYARKIQIFSGVPEKFSKPTVALPLFVDLFIQIVDTSALRRRRTVSSIFVILKIKY